MLVSSVIGLGSEVGPNGGLAARERGYYDVCSLIDLFVRSLLTIMALCAPG